MVDFMVFENSRRKLPISIVAVTITINVYGYGGTGGCCDLAADEVTGYDRTRAGRLLFQGSGTPCTLQLLLLPTTRVWLPS
jgi:hypothetical protein